MGDIVHYRGGREFSVSLCGQKPTLGTHETMEAKNVTCPDCLDKLGVGKGVDEEKVKFAEAIVNECLQNGEAGSTFCIYCKLWLSEDDHKPDCIVHKAEAYLKSVKGDEDDE